MPAQTFDLGVNPFDGRGTDAQAWQGSIALDPRLVAGGVAANLIYVRYFPLRFYLRTSGPDLTSTWEDYPRAITLRSGNRSVTIGGPGRGAIADRTEPYEWFPQSSERRALPAFLDALSPTDRVDLILDDGIVSSEIGFTATGSGTSRIGLQIAKPRIGITTPPGSGSTSIGVNIRSVEKLGITIPSGRGSTSISVDIRDPLPLGGFTASGTGTSSMGFLAVEPPALDVPENLRAIAATTSTLTLQWDAVPRTTGYRIRYRAASVRNWQYSDAPSFPSWISSPARPTRCRLPPETVTP